MHIYSRQLKYLWFPLPPLQEQRAVVRYLDHADRRIQHYVTAKRKLIALLEEEKQAISQPGPSPAVSIPASASSPPASIGSATCQSIGKVRRLKAGPPTES